MVNNVTQNKENVVSENILKLRVLTDRLCEYDNYHLEVLNDIKQIVDSDKVPDDKKTINCYRSLWNEIKIILDKLR